MELTDVEKRLLALHYVFPVPLNRLNRLYEIDPTLEKLYTYRPKELADLLGISLAQGRSIERKFTAK